MCVRALSKSLKIGRLPHLGGTAAAIIAGTAVATAPKSLRLEGRLHADPNQDHVLQAGKSGARLRLRHEDETKRTAGSVPDVKQELVVGAAQLRSDGSLQENVARILDFIKEAAGKGVEMLVLPEAAVTGYDESSVLKALPEQLAQAEQQIADACKHHKVSTVIGSRYLDAGGSSYNSAIIIGCDGEIIGRQHKLQLVPPDKSWSQPGQDLNVFRVLDVPVSTLVCHDKRYPELVRLPVLAGARVICYLACEAWHDDLPLPYPRSPPWGKDRLEAELAVYRAQLQARAVENKVWVVKANTAGCRERPSTGSHGMSCVIDPTGMVCAEADVFSEEMVTYKIDLSMADALYAHKSMNEDYLLRDWWRMGLRHVKVH